MTTATTDDAAARLDSGILTLRVALLDGRLRGERRAAVEDELQALRLLRCGIAAPGVRAYARRHGISSTGRKQPLTRGPETWGAKVAPRVVR